VTEASLAHPSKKLAVSLVAMIATLALFAAVSAFAHGAPGSDVPIINPAIDQDAYLRVVGDALGHRAERRLSEADFIRMSREPGTVVLDARSQARFDELHVAGAINLSFPDIAVESLARALPDKGARILIYCNNNFSGAAGAFPSKLPSASLNLPTYVALYDYGYRNVYELGPLIDVAASALVFAGTAAPGR
jgi:phage shock protein E